MERNKANKPNHLFSKNHSEYQFTGKNNAPHLQASNHAFLLKYASSIIQVLPEERLDPSLNHLGSEEQTNGAIEQSLIYGLESQHMLTVHRTDPVQKISPPVTPMKKKIGSRKILAYNFSNLTIFNEKIKALFKKRSRETFDLIRTRSALWMDCYQLKGKKEMKRGSDCSGYTVSTTNDERPSKRQSKKLTETILKELKKEGANQLKGFLQFKFMMNISNAFKCLTQYSSRPFRVSEVSTIKCQPVGNYQTADHSIEITRQLPQNFSRSLAYEADMKFQFIQKQVKISEMRSHMAKKNISFEESIVENYKPIELHICSPKRLPLSKNIVNPRFNKPINLVATERSREVWTNVYELPLLSERELKCGKQRKNQFHSLLQDHFTRNEPQVIIPANGIMNDLEQTNHIFRAEINRKVIKGSDNRMQKHRIFNKVSQEAEKMQSPMQRSTLKNEAAYYQSPERAYQKQRTPTIIIHQPNQKLLTTNRLNAKEEMPPFNHHNIYQINYNQPKRVVKQPKNEEKTKKYPQERVLNTAHAPNRPFVTNIVVNGGRQEILQRQSSTSDFVSKRSFYSPQVGKELSPFALKQFRPSQVSPTQIQLHKQAPRSQIQAGGRATSFTDNYYFTGSQAARPSSKLNDPSLNVFPENFHINRTAQQGFPKQSTQRINIFFDHSPMASQLQQRQRSNRFQRLRSDLSRPKSMNEKIFITLRK